MSRWTRALVAITLALAGSFVAVSSATAALVPSPDACDEAGVGYAPGTPCELVVDSEAQCLKDVPYISYAATVSGSSVTSLSITFVNPEGADVVLTGLPLTGKVPWPGAEFDADGNATDWPGWTKLDSGEWVLGDEYSWARPGVRALFDVNPIADVTIAYPESTAVCAGPADTSSTITTVDNPVPTASTPLLSDTGATVAPMLAVAGGLVGAGLLALLIARRRRAAQH